MSRRSSRFYRRSPGSGQPRRAAGPAHRQRRLVIRATAFATGATVAGAALVGAAPVPQPSFSDAVPVVQVQDVALAAFDTTGLITSLELGLVTAARELNRLFGLSDLTTSEWLDKFGLGNLTPNELLSATGLGNVTLSDLNHLAGIFGLNQNPISVLLAATGLSDATTLPQAAESLGLADLPLSNLYNLIGMPNYQDSTLSDLATTLGVAAGPLSNLYGLLGLSPESTLEETVQAFGIGDTQVDTLLDDWGVADQDINGFLHQLGVTPQELLGYLDIDPSHLPADIWDPTDGAFTTDTTVEQFADAAHLGDDTATQLLSINNLGGATLNEALGGIGLEPDATTSAVLDKIGFDNLSIGDFLSGFGLDYGPGYTNTVDDLLTYIPGFQHTTIGDLLAALGFSDHSTINDLLTSVPGFDDTTLSGLVTDLGWGDDHLSDLASNLLGDTTVDQYLTDIMSALAGA